MHDRVAELAGLRAELANCENGPRESRRGKTGEVQEQIERVRGELETEAEQLEARAESLAANGQDVPSAEAAVAARDIRTALQGDEPADESPKRSGKRTTAAAKAPQTRGGGS
ncbi:hypothetical protein ABT215_04155 [Streptomyces sp900105755]|uniref:hypothetical protein n=1 Tax=Streptomyces sp. 900105755 TaxID=3154389 RepID=UPI00333298E1